MNEQYSYIIAFVVGIVLGTFFFYGLWKTVTELTSSKPPSFWLVLSPIFRICITVLGFYFVIMLDANGRMSRIIICLLGFLTARFVMTKVIHFLTTKSKHAS
jgi:F1F0 ATPase subunit 2